MTNVNVTGKIHSIQSLGTVDGPGVRFVVFFSGCNLRCGCCHNPDTWETSAGSEISADEVVKKALRCREYFGEEGGITISGGEPLLQPEFARDIFALCKKEGVNTCLDTSGSLLNERIEALLEVTDRVLLDIKFTNNEDYARHAGCSLDSVLAFLDELDKRGIPTTVRQVVIPTINDSDENAERLKEIVSGRKCVDKVELLPFKKICKVKYDNMGLKFPFEDIPTPDVETMARLQKYFS